jgi:hypothetical protein
MVHNLFSIIIIKFKSAGYGSIILMFDCPSKTFRHKADISELIDEFEYCYCKIAVNRISLFRIYDAYIHQIGYKFEKRG